ncbi:MAG: SGNH/GDSL hydrolase family protein [bacterium]|nr:SGNH/GDSL hydrolase family protein [bacterium]
MFSNKVLLHADFEEEFWSVSDNSGGEKLPARTDAVAAHSGRYCLAARGEAMTMGRSWWQSPRFPVTPFDYYRIDFYSLLNPGGDRAGHWAAYFWDKGGKMLPDHYSYIDPSAAWTRNDFVFKAKVNAAWCRIIFHPDDGEDTLYIDDITVTEIDRKTAAAWADEYYRLMPAVACTSASGRWRYIPKTMERLRAGGTLRVVMLGDSIINDTGNSPYDVLVERIYPEAHLEVITSIRGSTGCGYYKLENRVKEYVLDYKPDLIIIGGISNDSAESVREVIHQIRAVNDQEILVMSGPVSPRYQDEEAKKPWSPDIDPDGSDYRSLLKRMAHEEKVEFLDMQGAFSQYAENSGKPYEWLMRDRIHANERGRAVLSRIIEAYFLPER